MCQKFFLSSRIFTYKRIYRDLEKTKNDALERREGSPTLLVTNDETELLNEVELGEEPTTSKPRQYQNISKLVLNFFWKKCKRRVCLRLARCSSLPPHVAFVVRNYRNYFQMTIYAK